ncbi:MAG: hypothetical protein M3P31_03600 [Actinomycetota bacterium]|nr:hypothetical protein [Actinomycetota bacterium]
MSELLLEVLPWGLAGSVREQRVYLVTLGVLVVGSALALVAVWFEQLDVLASLVTGAGAAGWLLSNAPAEGPTLLVLLPGNGLTTADLLAAPALALVGLLVGRRLRRRSAPHTAHR